ncbi:uncharacterized protein LOC133525549 isoform X2 [Cydia pomonella]|uniref:uncharacterized protein LOC133525549 isoform X2 n=1 Tax=Cydia pomonella TaxID=82600 RepID=UPI002ADDB451|nr:uncharacterized protein LOC133525549 isoform X2 [Cydia pomonella]
MGNLLSGKSGTCPNCDCDCGPLVFKDLKTIERPVVLKDCSNVVRRKWNIREAPQLGVNQSGRPVTPHKCDLKSHADKLPTPKPSAYRLRSTSSVSIPVRKQSRSSIKSHKFERGSSSTSRHESQPPPFQQYKSPTVPSRRPHVVPHNCLDKTPRPKRSDGLLKVLKRLLFALFLIGVVGAIVGPKLLRKARKKCGEISPCNS